jgi:hypothetical protein
MASTFIGWMMKLPRVVGVRTPRGYRWDCPHCLKSHIRIVNTPTGEPIVPDVVRCKSKNRQKKRWARIVSVIGKNR